MNRKQLTRRIGASLAAVSLIALSVGVTSAADTRMLYVGGMDGNSPGVLVVQPANVGTTTYVDTLIRNDGKQNLSNAGFGIGTQIAAADSSGTIGRELPAGWTVAAISASAGTCAITSDERGASCTFGSLSKNASRTVRVYLFIGADTTAQIQVSGKVAENQGGNVGANSNTFFAYGDTTGITPADPGTLSGFFKGGHVKAFTPGTTRTDISLEGNSNFLPVSIDDNTNRPCPSNVKCLPGTSNASVDNGNKVSPAFTWTSFYVVADGSSVKNTTTLYHFFDDGTFETITAKASNACSTGKTPCADFKVVVIEGVTYLQVDFKTAKNGYTKTRL